jgi:hypothetical protein
MGKPCLRVVNRFLTFFIISLLMCCDKHMVSQKSNSKPRIEADAKAFPELEPCLDLPAEYGKSFTDGIDFYTWQFVIKKDGRHSGVGFYFGFFPSTPQQCLSPLQVDGELLSKKIKWLACKPKDRTFERWDVVVDYEYGASKPIKLHVWIWDESDEQVQWLANKLVSLRFKKRT